MINTYLKGSQTDNSELRILKTQADKFYNQFTKEALEKYNLLPVAPVPIEKSSQKKATVKQVEEYNKLAKKLSTLPKNNPIIKLKDVERITYLYELMSATQKENAEPFPSFPPPPPPPPPVQVIKSEITWILLNSKGRLLVNDELGSLKSIEAKFKSISNNKSKSKAIVFRHGEEAPKDIVNKVNVLINRYNLKSIYNTLPPPPPPPAAKSKTGNGPNGNSYEPVPPPIPKDATPEERKKKQAVINNFEKKHKKKVHQLKSDTVIYNMILSDQNYDPNQQNSKVIKTGFIKIKGSPHYFVSIDDAKKYYNRQGFEVSKSGKNISDAQVSSFDVIPNQFITKVYSNDEIIAEFDDHNLKNRKQVFDIPPPPPPAPKSTMDFVIDLAKKNAKFFFNNKEISSDKAISLLKQNPELNLLAKATKKPQPLVYLSIEPIGMKLSETNSNKGDCLTVPRLDINSNIKTLIIPCIKDYPNNSLQIYNRWGKQLFSKSGYDNSWEGKTEDGKYVKTGTYYFVLKTDEKQKARSGYFVISKAQ